MDLLAGLRVVSFNHFLAGPIAAQILGDLGADVIAVEPTEGAFQRNWAVANHFVGGQSVNLLATARNKRSFAVDLKSDEGRQTRPPSAERCRCRDGEFPSRNDGPDWASDTISSRPTIRA